MASVCILTDSSVQFSKPAFPGRDLVVIPPSRIQINGRSYENDDELKVNQLPITAQNGLEPRLVPPSVDEFRQIFLTLSQTYNEIVAILISSHLSQNVPNALEAAESVRGRVATQVIDSQTTSIGLGILVQQAAEAASKGSRGVEIERLMRGMIPHIYTIFCIPGLSYLYHAGFIGQAQALVGEMMGLQPIFTLEDGRLTSLEKVRSARHLMDYLQEFLDEFSDLYHIALIQSVPPMTHEAHTLREHASDRFPDTPFSEHPIGLSLATLFGPRSLGVFAMELPSL